MAEEWKQATGGRVTVTVLRKMRLDALESRQGVCHVPRPIDYHAQPCT